MANASRHPHLLAFLLAVAFFLGCLVQNKAALAQSYAGQTRREQARSFIETRLLHWRYQMFNGELTSQGTKEPYQDTRHHVRTADILNSLRIATRFEPFTLRIEPGVILGNGAVAMGYELVEGFEAGLRLAYAANSVDEDSKTRTAGEEVARGDMEAGAYAHMGFSTGLFDCEVGAYLLALLNDGELKGAAGQSNPKSETSGWAVGSDFDVLIPLSDSALLLSGVGVRYSAQEQKNPTVTINHKSTTLQFNIASLRLKL